MGPARSASFVTNVDATRIAGAELAARKGDVLVRGLEAFGSVTYVDSRILSDPPFVSTTGTTAVRKQAPKYPDVACNHGAYLLPPRRLLGVHRGHALQLQKYSTLDNTDVIPHVYRAFGGFTVVNPRARYRFNDQVTVNLGIDNVGDTKYTLFHPFPGRTYVADVKF
jgi:iron complex outermembrane recepter protein